MRRLTLIATLSTVAVSGLGCENFLGEPERTTCDEERLLPVPGTVQDALAETDCGEGVAVDFYRLQPASPLIMRVTFIGTPGLNTAMTLERTGLPTEIVSLDVGTQQERTAYYALAPGYYLLQIAGQVGTDLGPYQLTTQSFSAPGPDGCMTSASRRFYLVTGAMLTGALTASDCESGADRIDTYTFHGRSAQSYSFAFTPSMAARIEILAGSNVVATSGAGANQAVTLTFTPTESGYYSVRVASATTGNYTLGVN